MKAIKWLCLLALVSCTTSLETYKDYKPQLDFKKFFDGKMVAHGYFKDRFNKVVKTFVVDMDTKWNDKNEGVLTEYFTYNDGSKSTRIWYLKVDENNNISGTASDVIGKASGKISGNTLFWSYYLNLEVDGKTYEVKFDDWMYLIDENTILNQSYMSKFGINLGEVVLSMRKIK